MIPPSRPTRAAFVLSFIALVGGGALARQQANTPDAAKLTNPVAPTAAVLSAGKRAYDTNCAACHGNKAQGAVKAGIAISIITEPGGRQAPELIDDRWDHGSSDGEIFTVIKRGVPPTMMAGWDGRLSDTDIWNVVNYLRAVAANPSL